MTARSPSALFLSLLLHGVVATLLVLASYLISLRPESDPPFVVELVAGPPTAPHEREAPALGNSLQKLKLPEIEPTPAPTPPAPEPPVEVAPPPPVPEVKTEPVPTPVPPKPVEKPKPVKKEPTMAQQMKQQQRVSYKDYLKKHPTPKPAAPTTPSAVKAPRVDAEGIANGVRGGSTANKNGGGGGRAMTREEASAMEEYVAYVRNLLKAAHEQVKPSGLGDTLSAEVEFTVAANGAISNGRIVRSSGNAEFDASVLAALRQVRSAGPRPDRRSDTWKLTFRMREED